VVLVTTSTTDSIITFVPPHYEILIDAIDKIGTTSACAFSLFSGILDPIHNHHNRSQDDKILDARSDISCRLQLYHSR
jgi:hypothetical protein